MLTSKLRAVISGLLLIILLAPLSLARTVQKEQKNEPEMLIKAARFLEEKPLDKSAKDIRSWALGWIIVTDKVTVTVCSLVLSGPDKKYKYSSEIFGQYTIAMAAFKLANPDKAQDEEATQLAGIESALNSYEAIVKEQPKAKNAFFDDLLAKRSSADFAKFVAANNCKEKK